MDNIENRRLSIVNANTIELHYWLNDKTHSMDAFVQNKCEYEFLGILKQLAIVFNAEIIIETEPLADGGLVRWFKLLSKKGRQKIKIGVIIGVLVTVIATPITTLLSETIKILIEKIYEDPELSDLEKENLRLEIELKRQEIEKNNAITKKRSNFYEALEKYPKVSDVSLTIKDNNHNQVLEPSVIHRITYNQFVLASDKLTPVEIDGAIIEIISPVLKKGNYKWRGIYNDKIELFNMKSIEFKTLVQSGDIEFKNGSAIKCLLQIEKRLNNEGEEQVVGYNILRVNEYFENNTPIETPEGKKYRQKREAEKLQFKLDFER